MKAIALSHREAVSLCRSYQHLKGAPINDQLIVAMVTIAPYEIVRWQQLHESNSRSPAELPSGTEGKFDVVLIAFPADCRKEMIMTPLRRYLRELAPLYNVAIYPSAPGNVLLKAHRLQSLN